MRKRAKHNLSHYRLLTCNMGQCIPLPPIPVIAGDTFQMHTDALVRCSPLNTPVMHPTQIRIHHWYVPNRVVFPEWEDFITGGKNNDNQVTLPTTTTTSSKKDILAYLGLPPIPGITVNALAQKAFWKIWNERYRDQDLVAELPDNAVGVPNIAWEKDAFSTARPWTQRGPAVTIPVGDKATVKSEVNTGADLSVLDPNDVLRAMNTSAGNLQLGATSSQQPLYADLTSATGVNINDFRASFALQRYAEARARYGARYVEYLRYLGINPSDARIQDPEFLGGGTQRLQFSEVLQTSPATEANQAGVGDMYGHGIAGVRTNKFRKFFEEDGYVISILSVRPKAMYQNGVHREWLKRTKEDYFQQELSNLGQQEVKKAELYGVASDEVFGYQDRYYEYRSHPSGVGQDFRDTLNAWHMARELDQNVALNASFNDCIPSDRIFQVGRSVADNLWIMVNTHCVARRRVPKTANPRVL